MNRALAEFLGVGHHTLYQVSTAGALVEGVYQGAVSVGLGGLAALYGGVDVLVLAANGQLAGADDALLARLGAACSGPASLPWFF